MKIPLEPALLACAALQAGTALGHLGLERLLHWGPELERVSLLLRQVHRVHLWFISVTVAMFAVLTWRFAGEMAAGGNEALRWLAGGMAVFWTFRVVTQVFYYSANHWRGQPARTVIHIGSVVAFTATAACYGAAAFA